VVFEVELTCVGVEDRFDGLAQGREEPGAATVGLALAGWSEQGQAGLGEGGFELGADIVLVPMMIWPGGGALRVGSVCRMSSRIVRSSALAPVSAKPLGRGVQGGEQV
jgi:hypothetical protein